MLSIRTGLTVRFIAGLCLIGAAMTFACAETNVQEPANGSSDAATEEKRKKDDEVLLEKGNIKTRIERFVCGWKAGKLNSVSVCENCPDPKNCKEDMRVLTGLKALAEQDCSGDFAKSNKSFRSLCSVLKNNCAGVKEKEMRVCKAFVGNDSKTFAAIVNNERFFETYFDVSSPTDFTVGSASLLMQLFFALKNNNEEECVMLDQSVRSFWFQIICRIAVGNKNPDEIVAGIANDLYYFDKAKRSGAKDQCAEIKRKFIMNSCIGSSVNSLDEFLDF